MKQAIAILDATGKDGMEIAKALAPGRRLLLFGHDEDKVNRLVKEVKTMDPEADLDCPGCAFEASWEADVIIMDTTDEEMMAEKIRDVATQKLVIEVIGEPHQGNLLQQLLPNSKVIQVTNKNTKQLLENIRTILNTTT